MYTDWKILWSIRGPRNNICYSGHVKYFSDWLIDWLISTIYETLNKTLLTMTILCCNNWSQSLNRSETGHTKSVRHKHVYDTMNDVTKIFNNITKDINSLSSPDPIYGIYIRQEWNHCWATIHSNLCSKSAWQSTVFSATLYSHRQMHNHRQHPQSCVISHTHFYWAPYSVRYLDEQVGPCLPVAMR